MSKRVLNTAQTALFMAILVIGSKMIGFVRELVLANYYGTGFIVDSEV